MFVLLVLFGSYKLCSAVAFYLRAYAPTNIALDFFRGRQGLKWALPAALVLTPAYWGAGYAVTTLVENGGPSWLNLAGRAVWRGTASSSPRSASGARCSWRLQRSAAPTGSGGDGLTFAGR